MNKTRTLKVSSRGQVTLPKTMREALGTDRVIAELVDGKVVIEPVPELAGRFKDYAKNVPPGMTWEEIREAAWKEATAHLVVDGRRRSRR